MSSPNVNFFYCGLKSDFPAVVRSHPLSWQPLPSDIKHYKLKLLLHLNSVYQVPVYISHSYFKNISFKTRDWWSFYNNNVTWHVTTWHKVVFASSIIAYYYQSIERRMYNKSITLPAYRLHYLLTNVVNLFEEGSTFARTSRGQPGVHWCAWNVVKMISLLSVSWMKERVNAISLECFKN